MRNDGNYGYSFTDSCILAGVNPASYADLRERTREGFFKNIPAFTAKYFNVDEGKLVGNCRKREVVTARNMMIAAIFSRYPKTTLKEMGAAVGGKDHSTVIHSRDTHLDLMDVDRGYRFDFDTYMEALKGELK